jgi:hypothetical protein
LSEWSSVREASKLWDELAAYELQPADRHYVDEGLNRLIGSLAREPGLNPVGFEKVADFARRAIRSFAAITEDRRQNPSIADEQIVAPLLVVGLPRSGTTFFHSLLAQDKQARSPLHWEVEFPSPPPDAASFANDPRIAAWEEVQSGPRARAATARNDIEARKRHLTDARSPDECGSLLASSGRIFATNAAARLHDYHEWLLTEDFHGAFDFHRRWLQHLQWRNPGNHWVLKNPTTLLMLDAAVAVYPDLRLIQTHREPGEVLSSNASFVAALRRKGFHHHDDHELGTDQLAKWSEAGRRSVHFRQNNPDRRVVDVSYRELLDSPMEIIGRVYDAFGLALSTASEAAMGDWLAANPQNKHGKHEHALSTYGLTQQQIDEGMAEYRQNFGAYL